MKRENLCCLFVLLDSRHEPQKIDLSFVEWAGSQGIPLCLLFTKTDKLGKNDLEKNVSFYKKVLLRQWEELPPYFLTSAETGRGRDEVLEFIASTISTWESSKQQEED